MLFYNLIKAFETIASKASPIGALYEKVHQGLVREETKAGTINHNSLILHIGCGSTPYTSELFAKETGAKIIAIDNDFQAVQDAIKHVASRKLSNLVRIEQGDGTTYPLSDFDVIIIALGVRPRDVILKRISLEAKTGAKIIYRNPKSFLTRVYSQKNTFNPTGRTLTNRRIALRESITIVKA